MRGYSLTMKDSYFDSILSDLLKGINVEGYHWLVMDCIISRKTEGIDCDGRYTGKEFRRLLLSLIHI